MARLLGWVLLSAFSFVTFVAAAAEPPAPSNAARIYASNTQRAGWRRFAGTWVKPATRLAWSDVLRLNMSDGRLNVDVLPTPSAANLVRSDRRVMVEIDTSPAIWAMSTEGRTWTDSRRKVPSNHFSAWASFDRGMIKEQISPALLRIAPGEKTFIGAGRLGEQELQVTFTLRGTEQGVDLLVENVAGHPANAVINVHAEDLVGLMQQKPAAVRKYLAPMLTSIAGRNPLRPQAGDVYRAFGKIAPDAEVTKKVEALLPQMESQSVEDRSAASSALDALGSPGILATMRMDRAQLSPEQIGRLDRAISDHSFLRSSADELKRNPYFLLDCLEDDDHAVRLAAKAALEILTGKRIDYPPDPPDADRATAIKSIEKIVLSETP